MPDHASTLSIGIACRDPKAELRWLEAAFGFETTLVVENDDGQIAHSEMRVGRDGRIMVGAEWDDFHKIPGSIGGINTQSIHIQLDPDEDLDAHYRRAVAAGATTLREPADQFYGDRLYGVIDPEGHQWTFSRAVKAMSHDEMSKAGGLKVRTSL